MRRIGDDERRARLALRHHLAVEARVDDPATIAGDLVGLHGTTPSTVYLAAAARMATPDLGAVERALYDERSLVRMLVMRRTVFVLPIELAGIAQAACGRTLAADQRRRLLQWIRGSDVADDPEAWLADVEAATLAALERRGEATAAMLAQDEPRLRTQVVVAAGTAGATPVAVSWRLLLVLALEGRIVRGRPVGTWLSSQYRWAPMETWLPGGLADPPADEARTELVRRWLRRFGPGTVADLRWWTGLTGGQVKGALRGLDAVDVELADGPGIALADDLDPVPAAAPWVALLPALDPTVMGWTARGWYLGGHGPRLFDRSGNAGPTVWCDGRVVGGWAHAPDLDVRYQLLEDVGHEAVVAVEEAAHRLRATLGTTRVTPSFRTPLERELAG